MYGDNELLEMTEKEAFSEINGDILSDGNVLNPMLLKMRPRVLQNKDKKQNEEEQA